MRPYLAILSDAFREAMHSRVLWILLGLILLVLVLVAPLTITYPLTSQVSNSDIRDVTQMAKELVAGSDVSETDVRRQVWEKLEADVQSGLQKIAEVNNEEDRNIGIEFRVREALSDALNEIINDEMAFTDAQIASLNLPPEARRLADGPRYDEQQKRLNRLVIETCFPDQLRSRGGRSAQVVYLIWPVGDQIPFGQQQVEQAIEFILAQFTSFFLGFIGVFAGVLVTASIIPNTFDAGSVNLLLSKPISRPLLYLTKVLGGCWFVLMNSVLLVVGIHAISGIRLGVWNHRILWCIPLFLFSFLIYYSVSALAGLVWRNTVVAITLAILFWLLCTIVGKTRESINVLALQPKKLARVIAAGDQLLSLTDTGRVQLWDEGSSEWEEVFKEEVKRLGPAFTQRNDLVGPIYDAQRNQLLAVEQSFGSGKLYRADADGAWSREALGIAPRGCRHLVLGNRGELFAIHRSGFSRLAGGEPTGGIKWFGMSIPGIGKRSAFEALGPKGFKLSDQATACVHLSRPLAFTVDKGALTRMVVAEDGKLEIDRQLKIGTEDDAFLVCASGDLALVGDSAGRLRMFSAVDLQEIGAYRPRGKNAPRLLAATSDGRWFAAVFHDGHIWLYDAENNAVVSSRVPGQGDVSTVSFPDNKTLLVVDCIDRVGALDLASGELETQVEPALSLLERVYRYLINPLYRVFPKPGQLNETNLYLLTESSAVAVSSEQRDLRVPRPTIDPWSPLLSSGIFAVVMLALGCIYITRQEF